MLVVVFGRKRGLNSFLHAFDPNDWNKRHHLFLLYKRVVFVRFSEQQFGFVRHVDSRGFRQDRGVLAYESLVYYWFRATTAVPFFKRERGLGEPIQLPTIQTRSSMLFHLRHQFICNGIEHENLFFTDTQQVVVVGSALNN